MVASAFAHRDAVSVTNIGVPRGGARGAGGAGAARGSRGVQGAPRMTTIPSKFAQFAVLRSCCYSHYY